MQKLYINISNSMDFYHPPLLPMPDIPCCLHYGAFFSKRKFDVHTGIDLYVPEGTSVYNIECGEVVKIRPYTGNFAGTDFWNETWAVDVECHTGIITYGEIKPSEDIKEGLRISKGTEIGQVLTVLKENKGKPMSMLHFAMHSHGWKYLYKDQQDPELEHFYDLQIDPTMLLLQLKNKADIMWLKGKYIINPSSQD